MIAKFYYFYNIITNSSNLMNSAQQRPSVSRQIISKVFIETMQLDKNFIWSPKVATGIYIVIASLSSSTSVEID